METKDFLPLIEKLAEKMGTTAEKVYGQYLKQVKLIGIYFWMKFAFAMLLGAITIILCFKVMALPHDSYGHSNEETLGIILGIVAFMSGIGTVIQLCCLNVQEYITSITNPEYLSTKKLIEDLT